MTYNLQTLALLLSCLAGPTVHPPSQEGLRLRLEPAQPSCTAGSSLQVRVVLENSSASENCYVLSSFDSEGVDGKLPAQRFPKNILAFDVESASGKVSYKGIENFYDVMDFVSPGVADLVKLAPGAFFGRCIDLSRGLFRYTDPAPGTYRIRARLESNVAEWFSGRINEERLRGAVRRCAPQGTLVSDYLTLEIAQRKVPNSWPPTVAAKCTVGFVKVPAGVLRESWGASALEAEPYIFVCEGDLAEIRPADKKKLEGKFHALLREHEGSLYWAQDDPQFRKVVVAQLNAVLGKDIILDFCIRNMRHIDLPY